MKLLLSSQMKEWDSVTVTRHFEDSADLMESAATACVAYIEELEFASHYIIVCGTGNNGGDGLCIGRLLNANEMKVTIYIAGDAESGSEDFKKNLQRVLNTDIDLHFLSESNRKIEMIPGAIIVDCLFGIGISRPVEGWLSLLIRELNALPARTISIDLPSGLMPDLLDHQQGDIIHADVTLTFQAPKRAMLFEENYEYVGDFEVLPIGLDKQFEQQQNCALHYYDELDAARELRVRKKFAHKNDFGHSFILSGSRGKMGAAVLCSFAAMRTGAGLVTAGIPQCGLEVLQSAVPEVMCECDLGKDVLESSTLDAKYSSVCIGPGIGQAAETAMMVRRIIKSANRPLVLDADALNIIALKRVTKDIPVGSVITPHVGEFDRLFGKHENSFVRFQKQIEIAKELNIIIVLKGAHTMIALPDGNVFFNSSGNVGMATAGSGDVLSGIIVSLIGQGHSPEVAARLGVFLHGIAGDIAYELRGDAGMIARDIIETIPDAILQIEAIKEVIER